MGRCRESGVYGRGCPCGVLVVGGAVFGLLLCNLLLLIVVEKALGNCAGFGIARSCLYTVSCSWVVSGEGAFWPGRDVFLITPAHIVLAFLARMLSMCLRVIDGRWCIAYLLN